MGWEYSGRRCALWEIEYRGLLRMMRLLSILLVLCVTVDPARAQDDRRLSHCVAIAEADPGLKFVHRANWSQSVPDFSLRIHYIAHASFLLQTPGGLTAITDYTGFHGSHDFIPDVVTMNHAHASHWTARPDPRIPHVLRGWGETWGAGIEHYLDLGEMLIRNVSTDIRSSLGGREERGNSIFIFEVEGLCIGHLGHLHHIPNQNQFAALGRLDVVMAPVDGGLTLPLPDIIATLKRLKSSIVIPMHWFSRASLEAFLVGISDEFNIDRTGQSAIVVSLRSLPKQPTVVVLEPQWLYDTEE